MRVRSEELFDHADGVLDIGNIERLHDMRVATRRLRAALEVFGPCFPPSSHERTLESVKTLADALGERRDRDVAIEQLDGFAAGVPGPDRRGVASLVSQLRVEQRDANDALVPLVSQERMEALRKGVSDLIAGAVA